MARDVWHNEDLSPAVASVTIVEPVVEEEGTKGCGCASARSAKAGRRQ
jgi:hypothetical protein